MGYEQISQQKLVESRRKDSITFLQLNFVICPLHRICVSEFDCLFVLWQQFL